MQNPKDFVISGYLFLSIPNLSLGKQWEQSYGTKFSAVTARAPQRKVARASACDNLAFLSFLLSLMKMAALTLLT